MINHFTFNGTSTAQLGLIVSGVSIFGAGSRKVEKAGIPGRNGDLQIELGGFNNYTVRYTVSITKNFTTTAQQIREWLLEAKGYCDLTDTYHPDEIRKACFNSDIEFTTSMLYKYGQASIQFDCLPERYLTTNTPITTTATADTTTDTTMSLSTVPTPITISLNGNTTQEGTPSPTNPQPIHNVSGDNTINVTGKNILSPFIVGIVLNTTNGSESASVYGATTDFINVDFSAHPSYYISGLSLTIHSYICAYNSQKQFLGRTASTFRDGQSLTTSSFPSGTAQGTGDIAYLRVCYYQQGTDTDVNTANNYLTQLEVGNSRTDFEPYKRQGYPLNLPVENLLQLTRSSGTVNGVTVTRNQDGTWTLNGTATGNISYLTGNTEVLPNGTNYILSGCPQGGNTTNGYSVQLTDFPVVNSKGFDVGDGLTFTSTGISYAVRLYIKNGAVLNNLVFKPQIEKGSHVNHYTPYGTTPIELNKIGTYQDYIYKNGGKWYLHKETASVDLGTFTWTKSSSGNKYYTTITPPFKWANDDVMLCSSYTFDGIGNSARGFYGANGTFRYAYLSTGSPYYEMYFTNESISTRADFKTSANGVLLYYPLQTATNTEITDTTLINQLNNIEKAYSYNGTTNILQVSNDNGFMLSVVSLHGSTFNSNYKGEPIITVNSTGLIYLNGEVMEVLSAPVTINCQTMQCYNGVVNMNNEVRVNDFPEIKIGENIVGSSMALTITPNNWRH